MSYYPPSGPPPNQGAYPPPNPQQPGYGYPPQQQGGYPPPQQGGYPPPPQQGFPPQQGGWGQPPPGGFQPPPGPPSQWQQPAGIPPQQQQFPPQVPTPASPGYDPRIRATGNASNDANILRKAMKGFGTDEKALIAVLSKPDPLQMTLLRESYRQQFQRDLEKDIISETGSWFREGLVALVRGPLYQDAHNVNKSIKGLGTKETFMNDVLCGRSNADMRAIKQAYHEIFKKSMEADVESDLSMETKRLFKMIMAATRAEESAPIIPQQLEQDVTTLHNAMGGRIGTDSPTVCSIISQRSDGQVRAIAHLFKTRYQKSLEDSIRSEISGHMQDALLLMVRRATDRAMTDAVQLEDAMAGLGTKDDLLVNRVVRAHWDRAHMDQVKRAYQHRYKKDLISRVKGETSGDYERLLVACLS